MSKNVAHKTRAMNSRHVELASSYSGRSKVQSAKEQSRQPSFDGNAAPVLAPEIEPKRKANKKHRATEVFKPAKQPDAHAQASPVIGAVKLFVASVFIFALVGFLNITFTSMAVASATQADAITAQISDEREAGKVLEVEYGTLSNPASVKDKASALGMEAPTDVLQINLLTDPVLTKEDGTIALCSTLKAAANQ